MMTQSQPGGGMSGRVPIVGIGASAGGVEALRAFFSAMPPDNGLAFVVVMHLDPTHQSMLADIIGSRTTMPVKPIQDGDSVEAEHVYVLPPGEVVTIEDGRLRLRKRAADRHQGPIDLFFTSLAEDQGEEAIGIVLSGGGSDGTLGVVAIKEQGGLTMAQGHNGSEPRFRDIPGSATATGLVDLVVPVELMPERLVSYVRSAEEIERTRISAATNTIYGLLRSRLGHDFSQYKEKTFGRRVQRRMQVLSLTNIDDYVERLKKDQDQVTLLFRDLLIGGSNFFRDSASFEALEQFVIPKLFEASRPDGEIRVWVPGCSTGEELYSIAILLREHMDKLKREPIVRLFATDIDERALTIARFGQYASSAMKEVSPERLRKYFHAEEGSYRVKKELRDLCIFAPHNVIRDPPFSRLDLISCRNVLIYLKAEL